MKNNSKKHEAFGLIEVVISMMILSIISMSIYNGYLIMIKQTKAGEVKQTAALNGKKAIEEIQAAIQDGSFSDVDNKLKIGSNPMIEKQSTDSFYTRNLDGNYVEKITVTPTKIIDHDTEKITLDDKQLAVDESENTSNINYKVYIGKEKNLGGTAIEDYIKHETADSPTPLDSDPDKIVIYVYFETPSDSPNDRSITINDFKGNKLLETTETLKDTTSLNPSKVNLCINFNNYKPITSDLANSNLKNVEIYAYNKTKSIPNIYMEKNNTLNANVKVCKGEITIYNNRAEDTQQDKIGTLYDIKVEIYKDNVNLFTGYSKKNIGE